MDELVDALDLLLEVVDEVLDVVGLADVDVAAAADLVGRAVSGGGAAAAVVNRGGRHFAGRHVFAHHCYRVRRKISWISRVLVGFLGFKFRS